MSENHQFPARSNIQGRDAITSFESLPLSDATKNAMNSFIQRFPDLDLTHADAATLIDLQTRWNINLPEWLQQFLQGLLDIAPHRLVWIQFDQFERWSPHGDHIDEIWYQFGLTTEISSEFTQVTVDGCPLLIVASWLETLHSILALRMDTNQDDQQVYEFDYEDINIQGELPSTALRIVFSSYAAFFDHIVNIELN